MDKTNLCVVCLQKIFLIDNNVQQSENRIAIYAVLKNICFINHQSNIFNGEICNQCAEMARITLKFQKLCQQSKLFYNTNLHTNSITNCCDIEKVESHADNCDLTFEKEQKTTQRNQAQKCLKDGKKNHHEENQLDKTQFKIDNSITETTLKDKKSYMCTICEKSFQYANSLQVHMRTHTQEAPYKCKLCDKTFKYLSSLHCHKRTHTGEQPHVCKICGKRYKQLGTLTAHMRIHTGQKPFLCSICGRGFRQAADLGHHTRTHTKEKPFMCSICGKTMSMQSHLTQHMRIHTGEKPFRCNVCEKAFPSSTRLKRHAIIHTDDRPYKCEVCSKSFNRASSLKVHSKIHTDERSYVCTVCTKGFIQAHALKLHLSTHSADLTNKQFAIKKTVPDASRNALIHDQKTSKES